MGLNDQEEAEWAEVLATYEKAVAVALKEIDRGRPQDAADLLRQAEHEVHTPSSPCRQAVAKLRAVAANPPLTELCEEHVKPWQEWFDNYKRVMKETERYTLPTDHPDHPYGVEKQ